MITGDLLPHNLSRALHELAVKTDAKGTAAFTAMVLACERNVKTKLHGSSHKHGTPTPASKGGPPATVTGNLARSITHSPVAHGAGDWESKIGPSSAGYYGQYQELDLDYPFLVKTIEDTLADEGPEIWAGIFGIGW